ncbi:MAG: hypothetical protein M3O70_20460 [Actinomycetota bacterium]|nr:hypothetical protein [Actinomycetota bacterium]
MPLTFAETVKHRLKALGAGAEALIAAAILGRRFDWTLLPEITALSEDVVLASLRRAVETPLAHLASEVPVLVADLDDALCETLSLAGKTDAALEVGAGLIGMLASLAAPPQRLGHVHLRLARAAATANRWDVVSHHLGRARDLAEEAADEALAACVDAVAAHVAIGRGDPPVAIAAARSALAVTQRLGLHEVACEALEVIGRCARLTDIATAEEAFEGARRMAEEHGLTLWRIRALFELCTIDLINARSLDRC